MTRPLPYLPVLTALTIGLFSATAGHAADVPATECDRLAAPHVASDAPVRGVDGQQLTKHVQAAVAACRTAMAAHPDTPRFGAQLIRALQVTAQYDELLGLAEDPRYATHPLTLNTLAVMYEFGHGVEKTPEKAFNLARRAAELGLAYGQNNLGRLYREGIGTEADFEQSRHWLTLALENGEQNAGYYLGQLYWHGQGVEKDPDRAVALLKQAAQDGSPIAQFLLARFYQTGTAIERDHALGFEWMKRAAEANWNKAQNYLGVMYSKGDFVSKDLEKSFGWKLKAALNGDTWAQGNVGYHYLQGDGVSRSKEKAYFWFGIAKRTNDTKARNKAIKAMSQIGRAFWDDAVIEAVDHAIETWQIGQPEPQF